MGIYPVQHCLYPLVDVPRFTAVRYQRADRSFIDFHFDARFNARVEDVPEFSHSRRRKSDAASDVVDFGSVRGEYRPQIFKPVYVFKCSMPA